MGDVVLVKYKPYGKISEFEVDGCIVKRGDLVVIESDLGLTIGKVISDPKAIIYDKKKMKKILRIASEEDIKIKEENSQLEKEAKEFCLERIMARGLPMKLIETEVTLDKKRIIFYFNAEKRIDFRELVKDLASKFRTRIEMRQIGVRDGAKIIGSLGICGRELCCKQFLTNFEPISIKMAKKQELVLNTGKLSGSCGRLMCCLSFEYTESDIESSKDEEIQEIFTDSIEPQETICEEPEEELIFSSDGIISEQIDETPSKVVIEDQEAGHSIENEKKGEADKHIIWPKRKRKRRFFRRRNGEK